MKFALESILETSRYVSDNSAAIQREVERLIYAGRQADAFALYQTDTEVTQLNEAQFAVVFPVDRVHLRLAK